MSPKQRASLDELIGAGAGMTAPGRKPHLAYGDVEAVLDEIAHLAGGIGVHVRIIQDYADLGAIERIALPVADTRACLVRLIGLLKVLLNG